MKNNIDLKIFITAMLLLDFIDETEGDSRFKHKLRYNLNATQKSLENITDVNIDSDELSKLLTTTADAMDVNIAKHLYGA
tara:strand:- start:414 stop:653 length:240 start_codon:yes stop_codon:yes gene_type:complete